MASALELQGIGKRFGSLIANEGIDLTLEQGEIVALLGENGAGKTTLMNVLFGHYRADSGSIHVNGTVLQNHTPADALAAGVGMVHQHFTLADNLTVLDNVILGTERLWLPFTRRRAARARLEGIIADSGLVVPLDVPVNHLTVGERQRVEILKALYRNVRILILDEPTAVLTPQEVDDLFVRLRRLVSEGMAIIVISHKLHEVMAFSDRVVVLRDGHLVGTAITADVDRDVLAEMIVGRRIERTAIETLIPGRSLLSMTCASVHGSRPLIEVNLELPTHAIVGLAGISGNGQGTLAEVLSGLRALDSGTLVIDGETVHAPSPGELTRRGLARIPEDRHRHGIVGEMSLWENLMLDELGEAPRWHRITGTGLSYLDRDRARADAAALCERFDVRGGGIDQPAALLSGGNMQKLIVARNLSRHPRLIVANQPTRGLDEGAIAAVHALLVEARNAGAAVLLITEDLDELLKLADTVVVMHAGRLSAPRPAAGLGARELGLAMSGVAA